MSVEKCRACNEHPKTVKQCVLFSEQKCQLTDEMCWFKHQNENDKIPTLGFREENKNLKNT